jgi:hypothetical protein
VHLDLPVCLNRRLPRGQPDSRTLRATSFLLHRGLLAVEAAEARAFLWAAIAWRWALAAVAAISAEARALASIMASEAAATIHAAAHADDVLLLRTLTALGVLVLCAALLPAVRRSLLAAFGGGSGIEASVSVGPAAVANAAGSAGVQTGQIEQHEQPQQPQQHQEWAGPRRPFAAADWHCVVHDRAGGVARMDNRALASMAEAGAAGAAAASATVGEVVGRLLTHRVRGVLLSCKGL